MQTDVLIGKNVMINTEIENSFHGYNTRVCFAGAK